MEKVAILEKRVKKQRLVLGIVFGFTFVLVTCLLIVMVVIGELKTAIATCSICLVLIGFTSVIILSTYKKSAPSLHKYLKSLPEIEKNKIEENLSRANYIGGVVISPDLIIWQQGVRIIGLPLKDIIWMYTEKMSVYGAVSTILYIVKRDKKRVGAPLVNKISDVEVSILLREIQKYRPKVFIGNTPDNLRLYNQNFNIMVISADDKMEKQ